MRLTVKKFIESSNFKFNKKYDYSKVKFTQLRDKIIIICPIHGEFITNPRSHLLSKVGCKSCAGKNKKTTKKFIEDAKKVHGDKYDYSKVKYTGNKNKVSIICPTHGEFKQDALKHIQGQGCSKCYGNNKKTTKKFIEDAKKVHGDKYDYSKVKYTGNRNKVSIICPIHGEFKQTPNCHLNDNSCPKCAIDKNKISLSYTDKDFIQKSINIHGDKYDYSKVKYTGNKNKVSIICPTHGEFKQTPNCHLNGSGCSKCGNHHSTQHEYVKQYFLKNKIHFLENKRLIYPYEVDFYLPDYNISIECNGIHWHSEKRGKDKKYHLNKTQLCKDKGVQLIHINENEFINSKDIIKSKLNSILNINKKPLYARKCKVKEIDTKLKSKFLKKYHLQGNDKASVKLGLFYNNKLVSVMTFCKRRVALGKKKSQEGEYELSRFCGNFNFYVIGGASKLLKYFERNYNPKKIVTYADKRWSTGGVYFKLGFTYSHDSDPNYWYFNDKKDKYKLYHRFNFRKSELSKKLDKFDPNKTEWENMKDNGWNRIWDCGNIVFEKEFDK